MIMVEFAGTPGCGKSTVCQMAAEKLREEGISARDVLRDEMKLGKAARMRFRLGYKRSPRDAALRREVKRFVAAHPGKTAVRFGLEILKASYKLNLARYQALDVVLMNEGPTQFLTSIAHMERLDARALIEEMNKAIYRRHKVILIDTTLEEQENIRRIMDRHNVHDRFYSEDAGELAAMLRVKRANIDSAAALLEYSGHFCFDNAESAATAQEVVRMIEEALVR